MIGGGTTSGIPTDTKYEGPIVLQFLHSCVPGHAIPIHLNGATERVAGRHHAEIDYVGATVLNHSQDP